MFMALNVVSGILVSQPTVPFVARPAIYPGPVRSRSFAGAVSSPVTWPVSVGRLGASLFLRALLLLLLVFLIQFLFQLILFLTTLFLILFLTTLFLFLLLVPGMAGTCPLSPRTILLPIQFLFRPIRPSLLMIFLADLVRSIPNVFRPSQLHFLFLGLKFLLFQDLNLCLFVSIVCVRSFCTNF